MRAFSGRKAFLLTFVPVWTWFLGVIAVEPVAAQKCLEPGFRVDLIAAFPDIEHPSVVTCDDVGNLFVGEDPMDMRGPTTKEFDRVLRLTIDESGKVTRRTVFCEGLSAVFGLVWHGDALYVMHAPHYSRFRDLDGDGVADERVDLADGFGPPAGIHGFNDHIVTGTRRGLDGRIYISIGDKGIPKATGSDGSVVTLEGGGVVRMTIDGRELEVVTSGTRNHLDVAMNSVDDIFTYDNTDDGLGWWTRFTHHVPTGYYGYPFDYHPHPERHLPAISEHGGGSPVGADCYRESVWPESMREAAFHCEWGKRSVQCFRLTREGATYRAEMKDFLVPEEGSEFRPQDLCFSPDGRFMYVADWQFGGWVQDQKVGRLYRVSYVGEGQTPAPAVSESWDPQSDLATAISRLGDPSYSVRRRAQDYIASQGVSGIVAVERAFASDTLSSAARIHAVWAMAAIAESGESRIMAWLAAVATADDDGEVRAQAARAIGMLAARRLPAVVTVTEHEYRDRSTQVDDAQLAQAVSALTRVIVQDAEPRARLQGIVALGRIGMPGSFPAMASRLVDVDPTVRFVARRALRSLGRWEEGMEAAGAPANFTSQLVLATVGVFDEKAVALLASIAEKGETPSVRAAAIMALAEVHQRSDRYESGWWGTRPAAGPPGRTPKYSWGGSTPVVEAIRKALRSDVPEERVAAMEAMLRVQDDESLALLRERVADAALDEASRRRGIEILGIRKDPASVEMLADLAESSDSAQALRDAAVSAIRAIGGDVGSRRLAGMVGREDTPPTTLVAALEAIAAMDLKEGASAVARRLHHEDATVRAAAIRTLSVLEGTAGAGKLLAGLEDSVLEVRLAAIETLGRIRATEAVSGLMQAASAEETRVAASLALIEIGDRAAMSVFLAAMLDPNPQLRERSGARLLAMRDAVLPELRAMAERNELKPELKRELATLFARPEPIRRWWLAGAWDQQQQSPDGAAVEAPDFGQPIRVGDLEFAWAEVDSNDEGVVDPGRFVSPNSNVWADAVALVVRDRPGKVAWTIGSDDQAILWVNGEKHYEFLGNRGYSPAQGSGEVELRQGVNVIRLRTGNASGPWQFGMSLGVNDPELAFLETDLMPGPDLAAYRDFATANAGDPERGKVVFFAAEGIGCAKCHAVGKEGMADIGPNLLALGAKYPREELIRSVLEPSNRIFSGYEMTVVETESGEVIQGVVRSESETELVLGDARGELIRVPVETIVNRARSERSAMPEGLEKGLSVEQFADLIAYLESLKASE